jgi:hypothetical protein
MYLRARAEEGAWKAGYNGQINVMNTLPSGRPERRSGRP